MPPGTAQPNPNPCCGSQTTCCPDPLPDQLNIQVVSPCGTYTGTLGRTDSGAPNTCWVGAVTFKCQDAHSNCIDCPNMPEQFLFCCTPVGSGFELNAINPSGGSCLAKQFTFHAGFSGGNCVTCPLTITVSWS